MIIILAARGRAIHDETSKERLIIPATLYLIVSLPAAADIRLPATIATAPQALTIRHRRRSLCRPAASAAQYAAGVNDTDGPPQAPITPDL